jgi:hypothetical protein
MNIKRIISVALVTLATMVTPSMVLVPSVAAQADDAKKAVCEGVSITSGGSDNTCADKPGASGVNGIIKLAINILSLIVGVVAVIMIVIGGLKYVTSQGEASNTAAAKNTILYAIIGLVIVSLAQFIVRFVLTKAGKAAG